MLSLRVSPRGIAWLAVLLCITAVNPAWADIPGEEGFTYVTSCGFAMERDGPGVPYEEGGERNAPLLLDRSEALMEDGSVEIRLESLDRDDDTLTFSLVELPRHGRLSGTTPFLVYTPHPDFHGEDYFTFRASDGETESPSAKVSFSVKAVNDAPIAMSREVTVSAEGWMELELEGRDVEGDTLTFELLEGPSQGELEGALPRVVYRPRAGASREDTFTFAVSDGEHTTCATVTLHIMPVSPSPIAKNKTRLTMTASEQHSVLREARDAEQDALTYSVSTRPDSGELLVVAPALTSQAGPGVEDVAPPLLLALGALGLLVRRQSQLRCAKAVELRPKLRMRA
ncbi:cadherin-like domain-containing protein [Corallococcus terminator]